MTMESSVFFLSMPVFIIGAVVTFPYFAFVILRFLYDEYQLNGLDFLAAIGVGVVFSFTWYIVLPIMLFWQFIGIRLLRFLNNYFSNHKVTR